MSSLFETLQNDMKQAMKSKDMHTLEVLRMMISSVKNKAIELNRDLEDADILAVLKSDAKKIKDALETFAQNAREDLADKAKEELAIFERYLPEQMTDDELVEKVQAKIAELGATTQQEMGKIVGALSKELQDRVDGSRIAAMVRALLSEHSK